MLLKQGNEEPIDWNLSVVKRKQKRRYQYTSNTVKDIICISIQSRRNPGGGWIKRQWRNYTLEPKWNDLLIEISVWSRGSKKDVTNIPVIQYPVKDIICISVRSRRNPGGLNKKAMELYIKTLVEWYISNICFKQRDTVPCVMCGLSIKNIYTWNISNMFAKKQHTSTTNPKLINILIRESLVEPTHQW